MLDIPSKLESALSPPRADGRWPLVVTDQMAVSFDRDNPGGVVGLKLHEGGLEYEVPREGVVITPEIPLGALQRYVGRYADATGAAEFAILVGTSVLRSGCRTTPRSISFHPTPPVGGRLARTWGSASRSRNR